jgi:hypothetical protein
MPSGGVTRSLIVEGQRVRWDARTRMKLKKSMWVALAGAAAESLITKI